MISLFDGSRHLRVVTSSRLGAGVERRSRVAAGHRAATQPLTAASPEPGCEVATRRCRWRHEDDFRGEPRLGRDIASQTCIRLIDWDQNHDACMRIGGEAPGRRVHSGSRRKGQVFHRITATSDVVGRPLGCRTVNGDVAKAAVKPRPDAT